MNQEQNNLNQNSFDIQGNNGIPNTQPLPNNQNFNNTFNQGVQQRGNINQPLHNVQQSVMGTTPQHNLNNKPAKKMKLGLIIGIISIVVVCLILVFVILGNKEDNKSGSNSNDKNNINNQEEQIDADKIEIDDDWDVEDNKDMIDVNIEKEEIKELSLGDSLVTSLIYPKDLTILIGYKDQWNYKNETIDTLGRSKMMYNAAFGLTPTNSTIGEKHYSADQIKNNFIKIYGPDVEYYDGNVSDQKVACTISKYDSAKNIYIEYTGCGGASVGYIDRVTQKYKAEQNGDYIYVYEYVKSVWLGPSLSGDTVVYLVDQNDQKTTVLNGANESNYESIIEQIMDKGEVDTYKWTFKKQSDGKYYFYSGAWEN